MASEDQYLPPYINNNDYKSNNIVYHNSKHPWLPPGFRFHPTDEELVSFYLAKKVENEAFSDLAIAQIDLNKFEPWDLPAMAKMGEREWYFYNLLDRKYPTGLRANRATDAGYWKATGKDREVMNSKTNILVGMKKTLVFYKGRAPKGEKSNWVMHEYRLVEGHHPRESKEERVVCRIFQKNIIASSSAPSLPPLMEPPILPLYSSKVKYPQPESSTKSSASLMITAQTHDDSFNEFSAINLSPNTILKALLDDNIMKQNDIFISNCIKHHDLSNNYHSGHGLEQQNLETMCIPNNTSQPQEDNNHSVQLIPANLMQHQNLHTNRVSTLSRCENLELDYLWKY